MMNMPHRPRRNRKHAAIRNMIQETAVTVDNLIFPLFLIEGKNKKEIVVSVAKELFDQFLTLIRKQNIFEKNFKN